MLSVGLRIALDSVTNPFKLPQNPEAAAASRLQQLPDEEEKEEVTVSQASANQTSVDAAVAAVLSELDGAQ